MSAAKWNNFQWGFLIVTTFNVTSDSCRFTAPKNFANRNYTRICITHPMVQPVSAVAFSVNNVLVYIVFHLFAFMQ